MGLGKSPLLAALAAAEALAPVVPDGWNAYGQPVGKPWAQIRTPLVQLCATSDDQTMNSWSPLLEMLREGPVIDEYPGLDVMETFVVLPKGRIEPVTSSATSREGARPVFAVFDQTESWRQSNGGVRLAATMRRNLGKVGGTSIESPNAFRPGDGSVAEASHSYWQQICEGKSKDEGLLYDHREAPPDTDMSDHDSLIRGLEVAYGDSAKPAGGWVDLERIAAEINDPATDPQDARAFYLGQITEASNALVAAHEWAGCLDTDKIIADGDPIVLGFDGSRGRARGKPDATALIGCRVTDGHLFEVGVWEATEGPLMADWTPPLPEIEAALAGCFERYRVVGFYADPARDWNSIVKSWEAKYGSKINSKMFARASQPFSWWMSGGRSGMVQIAVEGFEGAVRNGDLTHDGSYKLTQHTLNARRVVGGGKLSVGKEHDYSSNKIDACVAAILAWQARTDAVGRGVVTRRRTKTIRRY